MVPRATSRRADLLLEIYLLVVGTFIGARRVGGAPDNRLGRCLVYVSDN